MACDVKLKITYYDNETNQTKTESVPLGVVDENQSIDYEQVALMISKLSESDRMALAAYIRAAKAQKITKEMVEANQFISNITVQELTDIYPELKKYKISPDLQTNFTLIYARNITLGNVSYKGRVVNSKGEEMFIITSKFEADKFFKYLSLKTNLVDFISGNDIKSDKLKSYESTLKVLQEKYNKSIQGIIEDFLVNKSKYKTFKVGNTWYNPVKIINEIASIITGETYDSVDKSDIRMEFDRIKDRTKVSYICKVDKKKLYNMLEVFYDNLKEELPYDIYKSLSATELNEALKKYFIVDPTLYRMSVHRTSEGKKTVKEFSEMETVTLTQAQIQSIYNSNLRAEDPSLPKQYTTLLKNDSSKLMELLTKRPITISYEDSEYEVSFSIKDGKIVGTYQRNKAPVIKESSSYIYFNMGHWFTLEEIYDVGWDNITMFNFKEKYKGFYIYEHFKDGVTHYAISRSIISPKSFVKTFTSLEQAIETIDSNKETLRESGLYSLKKIKGRPRTAIIEMANLKKGQILTSLDIELNPKIQISALPNNIQDLFDLNVSEFQQRFADVPGIESLDSPEKASAFIFKFVDTLTKTEDFFTSMYTKADLVQDIIQNIASSEYVSYLVETKSAKNLCKLRLLKNNGTDIQVDGTFKGQNVGTVLHANLTEAMDYFSNAFGIPIHALTNSELLNMSQTEGLKLEDKIESTHAFVYNGEIYINTSIADNKDLFHEIAHILLGTLKVSNRDLYNGIIQHYQKHNNFASSFEYHTKTYNHYAQQDVIEETVVDLLAYDISNNQIMGSLDFDGEGVIKLFESLMKTAMNFTETPWDNQMGFSQYFKDLFSKTSDKVQRNMRISDKVRELIKNEQIIENC